MNELERLRQNLGSIDEQIADLLTERMDCISRIMTYKKEQGLPVLQPEQEVRQTMNLLKRVDGSVFEEEILDIFHYITKNSKKIQAKNLFHENIMLIGFMGAGKSTVSSYLSKMLALEVVEMDQLITEKEGMPITQIFSEYGEAYFRNCETNTLIELQKYNRLVVSCGGGAALRQENVDIMKKNGRIVLLTATPEAILERVKDSDERPLLNGNMNVSFIKELMEKRKDKYYAAADIVIDTTNRTIYNICEELIGRLSKS